MQTLNRSAGFSNIVLSNQLKKISLFMADTDVYKTIRKPSDGLYREKGSRFISVAIPVQNESEIKSHIEDIRKEQSVSKVAKVKEQNLVDTGYFITGIFYENTDLIFYF